MITMLMILLILKINSQFKESAVLCAEPLQLFPLMAVALLNMSDFTSFAPKKMRYSRKTFKMSKRSTSNKEKDLQCQNFSLGKLLFLTESLFELRMVIDHS